MHSRTVLILAASVAVAAVPVDDVTAQRDDGYGDPENRYPHTVQPVKTINFVHSKADEVSAIDNYEDADPHPEQRKRRAVCLMCLLGKGGGGRDGGGCGGGGCGGSHAYPNPDTIPRPVPMGSGRCGFGGFGGFGGGFSGLGGFRGRALNLIGAGGDGYRPLKTSEAVMPVKDMEVATRGGGGDGRCPSGSCDRPAPPPPLPIYYQQSGCSGSGYNTQPSRARRVVASKEANTDTV